MRRWCRTWKINRRRRRYRQMFLFDIYLFIYLPQHSCNDNIGIELQSRQTTKLMDGQSRVSRTILHHKHILPSNIVIAFHTLSNLLSSHFPPLPKTHYFRDFYCVWTNPFANTCSFLWVNISHGEESDCCLLFPNSSSDIVTATATLHSICHLKFDLWTIIVVVV